MKFFIPSLKMEEVLEAPKGDDPWELWPGMAEQLLALMSQGAIVSKFQKYMRECPQLGFCPQVQEALVGDLLDSMIVRTFGGWRLAVVAGGP